MEQELVNLVTLGWESRCTASEWGLKVRFFLFNKIQERTNTSDSNEDSFQTKKRKLTNSASLSEKEQKIASEVQLFVSKTLCGMMTIFFIVFDRRLEVLVNEAFIGNATPSSLLLSYLNYSGVVCHFF